jgi:hypothetical protein
MTSNTAADAETERAVLEPTDQPTRVDAALKTFIVEAVAAGELSEERARRMILAFGLESA